MKLYPQHSMKTCSHCKESKQEYEFNRNKASKDGLFHYCKVCIPCVRGEIYCEHFEGLEIPPASASDKIIQSLKLNGMQGLKPFWDYYKYLRRYHKKEEQFTQKQKEAFHIHNSLFPAKNIERTLETEISTETLKEIIEADDV